MYNYPINFCDITTKISHKCEQIVKNADFGGFIVTFFKIIRNNA